MTLQRKPNHFDKSYFKTWNADIFMGKFDDLRYIEEMNEEFNQR
jgi:hypothetical protein